MTTQTAEGRFATGQTLTAKLFATTGSTLVATADTVTERAARLGVYACAFGEASVIAAGLYELVLYSGATPVSWQTVKLAGADGETVNEAGLWSAVIAATGSGARVVTITVTDGTDPLENATVRVTSGLTYTATTNASGVATFNLDDATYAVSITRSGYSYAGTTLVVDGSESATYAMTAVSITPGSGDLTTGYLTALTEAGVADVGATLYCAMSAPPEDDTGYSYDATRRTITSGSGGLAQFPGLVKGATYTIWRGTKVVGDYKVTIPTTAGTTYELPSHLGKP